MTAAAYTNNDLDTTTTATTLFDIDTNLDQVVVQSPANSGNLAATGKLGFDAGLVAGFDIRSRLNKNGVTVDNQGFATLISEGKYRLYQINLLTGNANFSASSTRTSLISPLLSTISCFFRRFRGASQEAPLFNK